MRHFFLPSFHIRRGDPRLAESGWGPKLFSWEFFHFTDCHGPPASSLERLKGETVDFSEIVQTQPSKQGGAWSPRQALPLPASWGPAEQEAKSEGE